MDGYIQLKKGNKIKIGIKDDKGIDTGEYLEFDFEGTQTLLKMNKSDIMHKQNVMWLNNSLIILNKKEDKKGKYLLSWKQEEELKIYDEFYKKEMEAMDLFLGEGGSKKLLNAREPYYTMYEDAGEYIAQVLPLLKANIKDINKQIISKYSDETESENNDLQ